MLALRSVAGFAGNVHMASKFFLINDLGVTAFADVVTSESGSASCDLGDGVATVVSILSEAFGDYKCAENNEEKKRQDHHDSEANEMFDVLEHDCLSGPKRGKGSGPIRHVILDTGDWSRQTMSRITGERDGGHRVKIVQNKNLR